MLPLSDFATEEHPIRASNLCTLARCVMDAVMRWNKDDGGGVEAQTGSMVHAGVQAYHEANRNERVGYAVMASSTQEFPLADSAKARLHYQRYVQFEARKLPYKVIDNERKITFRLPPARNDPTQKDIVIIGTRDQLREDNDGVLWVVDLKTGRKKVEDMILDYSPQLAAYQQATIEAYPDREVRSAIARSSDLIYTGPFFHPMPWEPAQAKQILAFVADRVAAVRSGSIAPTANKYCAYCQYTALKYCSKGEMPERVALPTIGLSELDSLE
jgi:hypothetical protein